MGRGRPPSGASRPRRATSRPTCSSRRPARSASRRSRTLPGLDSFAGDVFHTARVEPRPRPRRPARRGRRHGRLGDPGRAEIQPRGRAPHGLPAHAAVGLPHRDRPITGSSARLYRRFPAAAAPGARTASTGAARRSCPGSRTARGCMKAVERLAARHMAKQVAGPRAARQADAGLRDRLQADPAVQRVVSGARAAERRRGHRRDRGDPPGRRRRRRRRCTRSTRSSSATGFYVTDIPLAHLVRGRDGRSLSRRSGRAARRPIAARRWPASRTCSSRRPQHRPGPQLAPLHDRGAARYVLDALRDARARRAPARGRRDAWRPTTPSCSAAWAARCGTRAAARAGTSTRRAATPRSGPTSRGATGKDRGASTRTPTRSADALSDSAGTKESSGADRCRGATIEMLRRVRLRPAHPEPLALLAERRADVVGQVREEPARIRIFGHAATRELRLEAVEPSGSRRSGAARTPAPAGTESTISRCHRTSLILRLCLRPGPCYGNASGQCFHEERGSRTHRCSRGVYRVTMARLRWT